MDIISLRKGDLGDFAKKLSVVSKKKAALLIEQAAVAKKLNAIYTDYVDDSKNVCMTLETCVLLSKRPGTLPYLLGKKQDLDATQRMIDEIKRLQEQVLSSADSCSTWITNVYAVSVVVI
jgi:hypothetical protein